MNQLKDVVIDMYISTLGLKKQYQTKHVAAIANFNKQNPNDVIVFKSIIEQTHPKFLNSIPNIIKRDRELPYGMPELRYELYSRSVDISNLIIKSYSTTDHFTFVSLNKLQKNIPIYRYGGFEGGHSVVLYLQGFGGKERRLTISIGAFITDFKEMWHV